MKLRVARPGDWRLWRDLRLRALADRPDSFGETLANAQSRSDDDWVGATSDDPTRITLFAERDGIPIGMAVGKLATDDARQAHLYAMWVAPEARRTGTGRALVHWVIRWARMAGAEQLILRVTERAPEAIAMYRSLGFRDSGTVEALRAGSSIESRVFVAELGPLVMGVVNCTPDSFSDGGEFLDPEAAIAHGLALLAAGADLVDVGGEATNPKAASAGVDAQEELRRIEPVIKALAAAGATVSVDTTKAVVASAAIAAGASIVNDVSGGLFDPVMPSVLTDFDGTYIAGHLRGANLHAVFAAEGDCLGAPVSWREVTAELGERLAALPAGVRARAWVDPGIGFGKGRDPEGNLALLRHAGDLGRSLGCPVVVGPSRKRFLRRILEGTGIGSPSLAELDAASVEASLLGVRAGARVVRVHNVALLRAALAVYTRM